MPHTNARSKNYLEGQGYKAFIVEKFVTFANKRFDFAGFADILAFRSDKMGVLAVQATTGNHVQDHIQKLGANAHLEAWLHAGNRLIIHVWAKRGERGERKLWQCREIIYVRT